MEELEIFRKRLKASEVEAAEALKARDEAQKRLDDANQAVAAWRIIVSQNANENSNTGSTIGETVASAAPPVYAGNKTEWLRSVISDAGNNGVTPAEIRKLAPTVGIELTPQFPYTTLYKLKETGKVKEINGRYYTGV